MDDVDDLDEEGAGTGGGVEDLDEGFIRGDRALFARLVGEGREFQAGVLFHHLAPGGGVGETVGEAKLGLQEFVDTTDDKANNRLRRIECPTLHPDPGVILLQEWLIEVNDRIAGEIRSVRFKHRNDVNAVKQVGDIVDEPEQTHTILQPHRENGFEHLAKKSTTYGQPLHGRLAGEAVAYALALCAENPTGCEQAVSQCLGKGISEFFFLLIVHKGLPELCI